VGVAESVSLAGPEAAPGTQLYLPQPAESSDSSQFLVRSSRLSGNVVPAIQDSLTRVLPDAVRQPTVHSLDEAFRTITAGRRSNAMLMSIFGLVALLVGAAGVHAVMTSMVAQQRHELGVRIALGARPSRIISGVLRRAAVYLAAGLAAGLVGGRALSGFFAVLLFQVQPTDVSTYAIVAVLLLATGLLAALLPALRAARVDPIQTLRSE
jgi:ABC-type antimicrobial peptide transport system permease subunit